MHPHRSVRVIQSSYQRNSACEAGATQCPGCLDSKCWIIKEIGHYRDCTYAEAAELPYSLLTALVCSSEAKRHSLSAGQSNHQQLEI